jgi:hypothetical protein
MNPCNEKYFILYLTLVHALGLYKMDEGTIMTTQFLTHGGGGGILFSASKNLFPELS